MVHLCFGGKVAGGSLDVDDLSSACRATKSLYRLLTVHVRMGVETRNQHRAYLEKDRRREGRPLGLTLDGIGGMWLRLGDDLS
jgi:hypothetical protein